MSAARRPLGLGPIYLLTLVLAACSLVYELLLAQTLSALLGNTVLRYSITIGCYLGALGLGAMACGEAREDPGRRLMLVEFALCIAGGLAVPLLFMAELSLTNLVDAPDLSSWSFLGVSHLLIFAVGFLSGFEIPLLMALGAHVREGLANRILALDYFGSLVGSVMFPLVLLPRIGLVATGFIVASLNILALIALAFYRRRACDYGFAGVGLILLMVYALGIRAAERIELRFAETLFSAYKAETWGELWAGDPHAEVEHERSPYQAITIGELDDSSDWIFDLYSDRAEHEPEHPDDLWLYLDDQFQLFSAGEEFYHEWFIHVPIQARGSAPRRVLLLGAGDGMALRELVAYGPDKIETIVHIELDPAMIELARTHPKLRALNGDPFDDPRVEVVNADAFAWLHHNSDRFDAIYVDAPYARDYNLSRLYSREFYVMVRDHLRPGGFLAFDAPSAWCGYEDGDWTLYSSTLLAAGLTSIEYYTNRVAPDSPRVEAQIARWVESLSAAKGLAPEVVEQRLRMQIALALRDDFPHHDFILARVDPGPRPALSWRDYPGVHHHALRAANLPLAFDEPGEACPVELVESAVNSVFRPTLPPLPIGS